MSKFTLLLLAATTTLATGCYAHAGYYAEPAYIAPVPVYVAPRPVYVEPYPFGYAHVHVTREPAYVAPRPVDVAPFPTYTVPPRETRYDSGSARIEARPRVASAPRISPSKFRH